MKLKYEFEVMEIGDSPVAVPVGVDSFHGVIHLNESARAIFELLGEETTPEAIVETLSKKYTESTKEEIAGFVTRYIEKLREAGLLAE